MRSSKWPRILLFTFSSPQLLLCASPATSPTHVKKGGRGHKRGRREEWRKTSAKGLGGKQKRWDRRNKIFNFSSVNDSQMIAKGKESLTMIVSGYTRCMSISYGRCRKMPIAWKISPLRGKEDMKWTDEVNKRFPRQTTSEKEFNCLRYFYFLLDFR